MYHQFSEKINSLISKHHAEHIIIPAGEQSKTFAQYQQTIESLLSKQLTRNTCIIALGGGATGFRRIYCSYIIERCWIYPSSDDNISARFKCRR